MCNKPWPIHHPGAGTKRLCSQQTKCFRHFVLGHTYSSAVLKSTLKLGVLVRRSCSLTVLGFHSSDVLVLPPGEIYRSVSRCWAVKITFRWSEKSFKPLCSLRPTSYESPSLVIGIGKHSQSFPLQHLLGPLAVCGGSDLGFPVPFGSAAMSDAKRPKTLERDIAGLLLDEALEGPVLVLTQWCMCQ